MIHIEVDDSGIKASISKLTSKLQDMTPVMRAVAGIMKDSVQDNFKQQQAPDGSKWQPHSAVTLKLKAKKGITQPLILRESGLLYLSITAQASANSAIVSTNKPYAAIHHFGGMAGRNHKVKMPARPFMGLGEAHKQEIMDELKRHFVFE